MWSWVRLCHNEVLYRGFPPVDGTKPGLSKACTPFRIVHEAIHQSDGYYLNIFSFQIFHRIKIRVLKTIRQAL